MLDIHTHHQPSVPDTAIVSVSPADFCPQPGHWYSTGIHPWQAGDPQWQADDWEQLLVQLLRHPQVLAVGEAGLDRQAQAPLPLQTDLFRRQALLAETVGKPLIIHAVKVQAELIARLLPLLWPALPPRSPAPHPRQPPAAGDRREPCAHRPALPTGRHPAPGRRRHSPSGPCGQRVSSLFWTLSFVSSKKGRTFAASITINQIIKQIIIR